MEGKILLAQEEWNEKLGFYRPCGVSPTWDTDKGRINSPYTLGDYLTDQLTKQGENSLRSFINREYTNTKYVDKNELIGKKFLYVINIYEPNFFLFNTSDGFKHITEDILNSVRNDRCKIILVQDVEGMSGMKNSHHEGEFLLLDKWCEQANVPYNNVYYVSGNLKAGEIAKQQNVKVHIIPITVQETWNNIMNFKPSITKFNPIDEKYLYLSYSRRPRFHRTFLLLKMFKENLQDSGLWSFNSLNNPPQTKDYLSLDKEVEPFIDHLYNNSPFLINKDNSTDDISIYVPYEDYERTFLCVAGETLYDDSVLFISEKTWKPIIVGSPFIINGCPKTLEYLKNEGFKTFDKWIDESYDDELDLNKRLDKIVNELKRFKLKSIEELKEIRIEMNPVCEHNKRLLRKRTRLKFFDGNDYYRTKPSSDVLKNIWNNWI